MKIIRALIFIVSAVLFVWLLCPLYKGVVHIGMIYPLPFLALFMLFSAKPGLLKALFEKFKVLSIIATSVVGIGVLTVVVMMGIMLYHAHSTPPKNSTVVVLGCQVTGKTPTLMLHDRMTAALEYLNENPNSKVVASGGMGPGESISEAEAIKTFLMKSGIDENRIYVEDKSKNTNENLKFSADIIRKNNLNTTVAVVTDGFHEFRGTYFAKKNNLDAYAYACNTRWYFSLSYYSREILAIFKVILNF